MSAKPQIIGPATAAKSPWERFHEIECELIALRQREGELIRERRQARMECDKILYHGDPKVITRREQEVIDLLRANPHIQNKEIAAILNVTPRTVKFHITGLFRKFSISDRRDLAIILRQDDQHAPTPISK